jgi:hypothetical protein
VVYRKIAFSDLEPSFNILSRAMTMMAKLAVGMLGWLGAAHSV